MLRGVAVGLKLTMASRHHRARRASSRWGWRGAMSDSEPRWRCSRAACVGYLALAGYWCWQLWERFGNPLFPFANQIFRSPYLPAEAMRDSRWLARGSLDYLSPPFDMALGIDRATAGDPLPGWSVPARPAGGSGVGWRCGWPADGRRCHPASAVPARLCPGRLRRRGRSLSTTTATPPFWSSWPRSCSSYWFRRRFPGCTAVLLVAATALLLLTSSVGSLGTAGLGRALVQHQAPAPGA